jgi:hypothetical protein
MTVLNNQSLFDIAVQMFGNAEAAFDLAVENDSAITDELAPGMELKTVPAANKQIADYYANRGLKPATASKNIIPTGIGFWAIDINFRVS